MVNRPGRYRLFPCVVNAQADAQTLNVLWIASKRMNGRDASWRSAPATTQPKTRGLDMKYIHISQEVAAGMKVGKPSTFNIGRNAEKRRIRAGKPKKYWPMIPRDYGYML